MLGKLELVNPWMRDNWEITGQEVNKKTKKTADTISILLPRMWLLKSPRVKVGLKETLYFLAALDAVLSRTTGQDIEI